MRNKDAIKIIEVLESIKLNPHLALEAKLRYVIESLKMEIEKNEFRWAKIKYSRVKNGKL